MTKRKKRRRKEPPTWKNSTPWPDHFLRRMVSWVCRELEFPRKNLHGIEFGNRTNTAWSGRAWCGPHGGYILVRIGPDSHFPTTAHVHRGGWTVGKVEDRIEALVKVTAHEVAHCDNSRRNNKSRGSYESHGNTAGSERLTDAMAKRVLEAFRENRDALVAEWEKPPTRQKAKPKSPVQKRAENAFAKESEWEKKLATAKRLLKKWKGKADYYRKTYPDGEYPEPPVRGKPQPKPETLLKRKISRYITMAVEYADLQSCKLEVKVFGEGDVLTRPAPDYEWEGFDVGMGEARKLAALSDVLEVRGYRRGDGEFWGDVDVTIPPTEDDLDACLKAESTWEHYQRRATHRKAAESPSHA